MKMQCALIIDDEPGIRELLALNLKSINIDSVRVGTLREAREALDIGAFSLCLTDMRLPDGNGLEWVGWCQEHYPNMPIAILTAYGNMQDAIQALKSGAFDFLTKPVDVNILRATVKNAIGTLNAVNLEEGQLIGESPAMRQLCADIQKLARSQAPVHILGESGVGKELAARMIHSSSARANGKFVPVNCAAIPAELLESEFFGHVKGGFTGAIGDKLGLFQSASGGTLFLDEVAELPQYMQVSLLRAIQEKSVRPVGSEREITVDVRLVSATNQDLKQLVKQGKFRHELYYRIDVISLEVPPLRTHADDIPLLARHIAGKIAATNAFPCPDIDEEAMALLKAYPWPGNVRELENVLERTLAFSSGARVTASTLKLPENDPSIQRDVQENLEEKLLDTERKEILDALEHVRWNRTAAARKLGLSLRALRYRLEKLGLSGTRKKE
ncbi:MAG: sigma-54-dependent transcriptional regulator [Candidatus Eutrophobiaceae bacterium]